MWCRRYDDAEVIKVLGVFEERITAMKESVALEINEKMEGAGGTVSSATRMLATGKGGGGQDESLLTDWMTGEGRE